MSIDILFKKLFAFNDPVHCIVHTQLQYEVLSIPLGSLGGRILIFKIKMVKNSRLQNLLKGFCSETTLHGWAYIAKDEKISSFCSRYFSEQSSIKLKSSA